MLDELAAFSAAIGADPEQVQAAGGNTSLKEAGTLWVKASGLWLRDARERDLFVPVDQAMVLAAIGRGDADPVRAAVQAERNQGGLRPSIETTLHALLPHPVVVHTHSVRMIALAVQGHAPALLEPLLAGLAWAFVPYHQPGLPLTLAVAAALRDRPADVLVLGNHGLVVGAADVPAAAALLAAVERRVDGPVAPRPVRPDADLAAWGAPHGLRLVTHAAAQALAFDPAAIAAAVQGSLYPDHVIFLGPGTTALDGIDHAAAIARARLRGGRLFILPGRGLLVDEDAGPSADELALCLALVTARLPAGADLVTLTAADEAALMDWDAEKYRQALAVAEGR